MKIYTIAEADEMSALTLAYIGDAVYEIRVREHLLSTLHKNGDLHKACQKYVSATAQSNLVERWLEKLTDAEHRAYSRGRNAKLSVGKRNNPAVHCRATGLESLVGWLYLTGQEGRLNELLSLCFEDSNEKAN